jgi:hypothetical protein
MINGGRDEIYITAVSSGPGRGYVFVEYTGKNFPWFRAFWDNIYTAEEALIEALAVSREYADKLGFRRPEGQ